MFQYGWPIYGKYLKTKHSDPLHWGGQTRSVKYYARVSLSIQRCKYSFKCYTPTPTDHRIGNNWAQVFAYSINHKALEMMRGRSSHLINWAALPDEKALLCEGIRNTTISKWKPDNHICTKDCVNANWATTGSNEIATCCIPGERGKGKTILSYCHHTTLNKLLIYQLKQSHQQLSYLNEQICMFN